MDIIRKGNCGMSVQPENVSAVRQALTDICNARHVRGIADYNWNYLKQFERREEAGILASILGGIHNKRAKKKILMIATDFPPDPSVGRLRTIKFCKYLPENGWKPIVLAPSYRYLWGRDEALLNEIPEGTKVYRAFYPALIEIISSVLKGKTFSKEIEEIKKEKMSIKPSGLSLKNMFLSIIRYSNRLFNRFILIPDRFILWLPFAFLKALRINRIENIDVIYTTIPASSLIFLGYILKKVFHKKWIIDYRDLWTGDHTRMHMNAFRKKIERFMERRFSSKADAIITTSKEKADYLKSLLKGIAPDKIFCITNGFDQDDSPVSKRDKDTKKWIITYTGRLYRTLSASSFVTAMGISISENAALKERLKIRFVGDIFRDEKKKLDQIINKYNLGDIVEFLGYVSYKDSLRYQVDSDALLLVMGEADNADGVIPTKIFEYMGSGRPIFAITPKGAAQRIIEETGYGISERPGDVAAIKNSFLKFYNSYGKRDLSCKSSELISQFDRRHLTYNFSCILEKVKI